MAPARLMISTDTVGDSSDGRSFDDGSTVNNGEALTRIVLFYGAYIDSLTMHYSGSSVPATRGSNAGSRAEIVLGPGEFITAVQGFFSGTTLAQLRFTNNKGLHFGPYGGQNDSDINNRFDWKTSDNAEAEVADHMGLHCFGGRAAGYIYQLRATFALYPSVAKPSIAMNFEKQVMPEPTASGVQLSSFARNMMSPLVALHVGPDAVVFHAYEATLCRVPFFRAALQGQFQEATEKKITMPEEKPEVISALIEYICTGNYTYMYGVDAATDQNGTPTANLDQGCFHVRVYAVAHMYDWPPLVSAVLRNFLSVLSQLDEMDIVRLCKTAYENGLTIPLCTEAGRLDEFQKLLPKLLKGLYKSDGEEMDIMIAEFPALASDFMRFLVESCDD